MKVDGAKTATNLVEQKVSSMGSPTADPPKINLNSFWCDARRALHNGRIDYTKEPLSRAHRAACRTNDHGDDHGLTESVTSLIYAVAVGISMAGGAIVARRIGENSPDRAARAAAQILMLALGYLTAIGLLFGYLATA